MTSGLLLTSFVLGLRHGVDWDHIAAIADLSGGADDRRRGFRLSFIYALGHAVVVFALGSAAIVAGAAIPDGLDRWMGRIVGLTLIWLGIWVIVELVGNGRQFRLRSRWMLILDGSFAGWRRVARGANHRQIEVEHSHVHEHDHDGAHGSDEECADHNAAHRHSHGVHDAQAGDRVAAGSGSHRSHLPLGTRHSHRHRHVLPLPDRLGSGSVQTGMGAAAGIGVLHGVGVESPTQIAVFVASTSVVGWSAGLAILAAWCLGLIVANAGLAALAALGLLEARRNFTIYATVAVVVAIGSIAMGLLYLFDLNVLPAIAV